MRKKIVVLFLIALATLYMVGCGDYEPSAPVEKPKEYDVTVYVDYQKVPIKAAKNVDVYVDSKKLGTQSPNTDRTFDTTLVPGEHKFYVKQGLYKTSDVIFDVPEYSSSFSFIVRNEIIAGLVAKAK